MTTRYTAKTKKTTFALIIAAVLAAALLFFAAWAPSGLVVEGAEGDSGAATQDTQYTHELSVSEADFADGYADKEPSEKRFELNTTETSGDVTTVTNGAVTAEAFSKKTDGTGSTIPYRSVSISLQKKLQDAVNSRRLSMRVYFVGSVTLTATSAGDVEDNAPSINLDLGFGLTGGVSSDDVADGNVERTAEPVWEDGTYTYSETLGFTAERPLEITDGYALLSSENVVLKLTPSFSITRERTTTGTVTNSATAAINGNFLIAFDFAEVTVNLSVDNVQYGKIVARNQSELYGQYAAAVMNTTAENDEEIDRYGRELQALESLTGSANSAVVSYGLNDDIVFTAVPMTGFYFYRWEQGGENTKAVNLGAAAKTPSSAAITYRADFTEFQPTVPIVAGQGAGYVYNNAPYGPALNEAALTGYELSERHVGLTNAGEVYNLGPQPTEAGAYEHRATLSRNGEYFGISRVDFSIFRRTATVELTDALGTVVNSAEIAWGECLNDTGIIAGSGIVGTFDVVVDSEEEGGYTAVSTELASVMPAPGTYEFSYRLTPTGDYANNYSTGYAPFTVTVDDAFTVDGDGAVYAETPVASSTIGGAFNYSYNIIDNGEAAAVRETLVFTLTAYLTGSEDWLFVAWRRNTYYQTSDTGEAGGFTTYTYVYEIPLDGNEGDKLSAEFRAVFARKDNSSIAVNAYTGSALEALTAVNLSRNNLYIGNATLESYGGITAEVIGFDDEPSASQPVAIGPHDVKVRLFTTENGVRKELVSKIVLPFEIVYANLYANLSTAASSGYNSATGWASRMAFNIEGMPTANTGYGYKYIYTLETDGKVIAENSVVDWDGAGLFTTPMIYGDVDISAKSAVITFRLVVTHDVNGVPTEGVEMNAVALSEPFTVKLDNTPVTISAFEPTAALGDGWLQSAQFTAEVTFGGSGYDLSYGTRSGNSLSATDRALLTADEVTVESGAGNSGYLYGADSGNVTAARSFTVRFTVDTDLIGEPALGVRNGLRLGANVYSAIAEHGEQVKIDASAPQITLVPEYGGAVGDGGWYATAVKLTLTITDNGGSMPEEAELSPREGSAYYGITMQRDEGFTEGIRYIATITSSEYFEYYISDGAGNVANTSFHYNVQIFKQGDLEFVSYSADGGEMWVSNDLSLDFTVRLTTGALYAPFKLQYRTGAYGVFTDYGDYVYPDSATGNVDLTFALSLEDLGDSNFYFRAMAANGITTETFNAGRIRNDDVAPTIALNEADYADHIGDADWTAEAVPVTVTVTETLSGIPWDEATGIYGVYVEGRDDVRIDKVSDSVYIVYVADCNEYVVSARDRAGNTVSAEAITLNVDPFTRPAFDVRIEEEDGETVSEYTSGEWITSGTAVLKITFTYDVVVSGSTVQYLQDGYWHTLVSGTPEDGSLSQEGQTYVFSVTPADGSTNYRFRLTTGAGITVTYPAEGYFTVRRDSEAPGEPDSEFYDSLGNAVDVANEWNNDRVTWQFSLNDSVSGINASKVLLYSLDPATINDEEAMAEALQQAIASGSGIAPEVLPNGLYQYTLSDYMLYVLMFADNAGNQGIFPFIAMIDTTADFDVNIVPYLKDGDVVGSEPLESGTALSDTQSVVFVFEVTTEGGDFVPGASGLRAEYSFDGVNWYYTDGEFSAAVPEFEFGGQAIGDMRIRLVTGAGTAVVGAFGGEAAFGYNKDTAEIALSLSAVTVADGNETPYTPDSWTNATVKVIATVTAGAYGGTLSAEGFEGVRVPENSGTATVTFEIVNNLNGVVTVTFTSDKAGSVPVSEEIAVKIDKDDVNVDLSGAYDNQGTYTVEIGEEGWAFGDVAITVAAEPGASGIAAVEYSYDGDGAEWAELAQVDGEYRILWANADNNTGDQRTYRVRVTSGSGMVGTAEMTVRIDEDTAASGTLVYEGSRGSGSDWYYTDVGIAVRNIKVNFSGTYFVYTATVIDGGTETDRVVSGEYLLDETGLAFMTLTDESFAAAGYGEYRISYSWATGAGNSAPGGEFVIKIDKNVYNFTAQSHIGGIDDTLYTGDNRYVVLKDDGLLSKPLYRGMSLNNIGIAPIAPVTGTEEARYEFLLRSISVNGGNLINYEYNNEDAAETYYLFGVTVEGNVSVDVELYCAIVPEFVNTDQSIQANGTYLPVRLSFPIGLYADFRNVLTYSVTMPEGFDADDPYGVYEVTAAITGEYAAEFPLVKRENGKFVQNDTAALRVRYFENSGTVDDRFTVGNLTDFMMIDRYSDPLDPAQPAFGYGNDNRYFIQTADIAFDASFVGLSNAFDGVYDGNGFAFTSDRVDGGKFSGIFKNVDGGRIENLKVEIFRYEISANGDYGLIAANIGGSDASVLDVYVAANVYIENSAVNFGGVAGTAENTLISAAFAAVNVFANKVSGNLGGVVGTLTDGSIMSRCVSLSTITNDDCALPDGKGGAALYAGSLLGYADGAGAADEINYYLNNGVSYGEAAISGRGLGNVDYYSDATALKFVARANIEEMNAVQTEQTEILILGNTVAELVEYYAESLAERFTVAGVGSEYAPFEIGKAEALELVALAPWAYFIQTDDIVPGSYAEFFGKTPFRGYYDGDAHKLSDVAVSATGGSVGLFRAVEGTLTNLYIDNIYADMLLLQGGYAGALAGIIGKEALVSGIVLTGSITVDAAGTVYAGGVAGISYGGIDNIVSAIAMRVIAENALVGGISGNLSGGKVEYVALLGSFTADYSGRANVGTVAGEAVADDESPVSMNAVGYVADSSIAGKYNVTIPFVGETEKGYVPDSESRNSLIASKDYSSGEYAFTVGERLNGVYPFTSGSGTDADPFVITGYKEFKNIAAYMDASFKLAENFVLGDIDGDGIADEEFTGFGGTFSGSIAGDNKVISGLTAPLFERVSGSIRNLVLNIEVYSEDVSVTFGAVAVTAESGAMLSRITVNGNAEIYTDAAGTIVFGGVVGISDGAAVIMPAVNVDVKLRGGMVVYGGIVGNSTAPAAEHAGTWRIQSSVTADVGGVSVTAGKYIGIMRGDGAVVQSFGATAAVLKINNVTDASAVGRVI